MMTRRLISLLLILALTLSFLVSCASTESGGSGTEKASQSEGSTVGETASKTEAASDSETETEAASDSETTSETETSQTGEDFAEPNVTLAQKVTLPFTNLSGEYAITAESADAYFEEGGSLPYMEISAFIQMLSGFIAIDKYEFCANEEEKMLTVTVTVQIYENEEPMPHTICFYAESNTVTASMYEVFRSTNEDTATDYGRFLEESGAEYTPGSSVTFPLGDYGIDVVWMDGSCLLPVYLLNMLFCSPSMLNLYYRNQSDGLIAVDMYANEENGESLIFDPSSAQGNAPADVRAASYSATLFALDYLYGLKGYNDVDSYADALDPVLLSNLLSTEEKTFAKAYADLFYKTLDEMHTGILSASYYSKTGNPLAYSGAVPFGQNVYNYMRRYSILSAYLEGGYRQFDGELPFLTIHQDTAVIFLTDFVTASDEELYHADGSLKDDAWAHDSYYMMKIALEEIAKHPEVQNVALDLSYCSGGNLGAMARVLGFLTDEQIPIAYENALSGSRETVYVRVDADGDGDFYDSDAYDGYRWFVLTSAFSFSAANYFSFIVKYRGLATLVGEKTSGGMCAVTPLVLPDGTSLSISSLNCLIVIADGLRTFLTEGGVSPDYACSAEYFYQSSTSACEYVSGLAQELKTS